MRDLSESRRLRVHTEPGIQTFWGQALCMVIFVQLAARMLLC